MNTQITAGQKVTFTPTGMRFEIAKVTSARISWYVEPSKSSYGKNTMRMAWITVNQFNDGLAKGIYKVN